MTIYKSTEELIGKTPLMELCAIQKELSLNARILAKLECFNPAGSVKDRVALSMINDAEQKGLIGKNAVIIEPTSGNTGIGLASICASRGYRAIFTMPDTMSVERQMLLRAYGAEVVLTEGLKGMSGAIEKAKELAEEIPGSFIPSQFENSANPRAHIDTTGPEIWHDTEGKTDIFVACAGTGGTVSGTGNYLKSQNPHIKVAVVEPADSPLLSGGKAGPHKIQGIGANFIPQTLDTSIYDEIFTATTEESFENARLMARLQGILVGISSGAALSAAIKLAKRPENANKNIVVLLPDSGERYLSTSLFE